MNYNNEAKDRLKRDFRERELKLMFPDFFYILTEMALMHINTYFVQRPGLYISSLKTTDESFFDIFRKH